MKTNLISECINAAMEVLHRSYYNAKYNPKNSIVHYQEKDNGEWGYVINNKFGDVVDYMLENDFTKIVDLGSGVGHGIELLHRMGFYARGYENEDILIQENNIVFGKKLHSLIQNKNVMTLTTSDIKDFEVLYCWDPFKDEKLKKKFMHNLIDIMLPGQVILNKSVKELGLKEFTSYRSLNVFMK